VSPASWPHAATCGHWRLRTAGAYAAEASQGAGATKHTSHCHGGHLSCWPGQEAPSMLALCPGSGLQRSTRRRGIWMHCSPSRGGRQAAPHPAMHSGKASGHLCIIGSTSASNLSAGCRWSLLSALQCACWRICCLQHHTAPSTVHEAAGSSATAVARAAEWLFHRRCMQTRHELCRMLWSLSLNTQCASTAACYCYMLTLWQVLSLHGWPPQLMAVVFTVHLHRACRTSG
jgi:hypothetical protein